MIQIVLEWWVGGGQNGTLRSETQYLTLAFDFLGPEAKNIDPSGNSHHSLSNHLSKEESNRNGGG